MYKAFNRLNITQIQPEGWLKRQLEIQMKGLSGKLYDCWDSVGSYSGWLGGTGESWERGPYYLDGLFPLAYYLNDKEHLEICQHFIDWTLQSQNESGNFGPVNTQHDYWSRFIMLKVLSQYYEVTGDLRVLPFMRKYFSYIENTVHEGVFQGWTEMRAPDLLWSLKWYFEQTQDASILEVVKLVDKNSFDWVDYYSSFPYPRPAKCYMDWSQLNGLNGDGLCKIPSYHPTHIVNIAMGLKHPAMRYCFTGKTEDREAYYKGSEDLRKYHGVVSGCVNGDEHLAGNNPVQGSELCSVVEGMFSLESLYEVFGDSCVADDLERLAFNALPATISEDWMSHQYLQQANQIACTDESRPWFNNSSVSNTYGLEPNFGCCTANMHQGWPKLVNAIWFVQNDALISSLFLPSLLDTVVASHRVKIRTETNYPFENVVFYKVIEAPEEGVTLKIRVPGWCTEPHINDHSITAENGYITLLNVKAGDTIKYELPMTIRKSYWYHNSVAIERGPLVYALALKETWKVKKTVGGISDYEITTEDPWNYAILNSSECVVSQNSVSSIPFSHSNPPTVLLISAKKLTDWKYKNGNTEEIPISPVISSTDIEQIRLVPYGCTHLRIAQFPYLIS